MVYTPNAEDAFTVYVLALSYVDDIPLNAFAPMHLMNVKELHIKGEFHIWLKEERDIFGRYVMPLATCTYNRSFEAWTVELDTSETFVVHDQGDVWDIVVVVKERT